MKRRASEEGKCKTVTENTRRHFIITLLAMHLSTHKERQNGRMSFALHSMFVRPWCFLLSL
jgi:hypothetical protein